jgi:DNA-3-methyladenine glycosylase II
MINIGRNIGRRHTISFQKFKMGSRRSSRLSGLAENGVSETKATNGLTANSKKRKTVDESKATNVDKEGFTVPSTPKRTKIAPPIPPSTPTPAAAKLIGQPHNYVFGSTALHNRLADPLTTNAPLISPATSRVLANKDVNGVSPSKPPQTLTTTGNILEKACAHLVKIDPKMKALIDKHHCAVFSPEGLEEEIDPFESLCSGIISQQVRGQVHYHFGRY